MNYLNIALVIVATIAVVQCCTTNTECSAPGATCSEGACTCQKGFILSNDTTQCLPYATEYYADCSEDAQCEWLGENSECRFVCRCKVGYRWFGGECKPYSGLGGNCSEDLDCYDGYSFQSLACVDKVCDCSEGYYRRGDSDCRKIASELNATCALDIDCQIPDTSNAVCHVGKCMVNPPEPSLEEQIDEIEETKKKTILYKVAAEKECATNNDCSDIPNSECYENTGTCICKKQYFFGEDGTCIPEVGVSVGCTEDSDCLIKPGKCVEGVCYCRDYYFVEEGNQNCVKTISQNNWNCLSNEWCYALGFYSFCNSSEMCQCSKIANLTESNLICEKYRDEDPDMCREDVECKNVRNGFCVDEACGCRADYELQENICVPDLGAICPNDNDCIIAHSECLEDGYCGCAEEYVALEKACYIKIGQLEDSCEVDIQCSAAISYSLCKDSKCICDENHIPYQNETCYQITEVGSYCNNRRECSLSLSEMMGDSIVCRNHVCQCPTGYTLDGDKCSSSSALVANFLIMVVAWLVKDRF